MVDTNKEHKQYFENLGYPLQKWKIKNTHFRKTKANSLKPKTMEKVAAIKHLKKRKGRLSPNIQITSIN